MPGLTLQMQAVNGQYVCAQGGGGRELRADKNFPLAWESFVLTDLNGLPLADGHSIVLQAMDGQYVYADGGGGGLLLARGAAIGPWEPFRVRRLNGTGPIGGGDRIALQAVDGRYVYAEGGGGGRLVAAGGSVGPWEPFTIHVLPQRHVRIELHEVYCRDTEDVTGADEFSLTGAASNRADNASGTTIVKPISINNGQTRRIVTDEAVLFDHQVDVASTIVASMVALDIDASHDWTKHGEQVRTVAKHVSAAMAAAGPKGIVGGALLQAVTEGVGLIMRLDEDDVLGRVAVEFPVISLPWGKSAQRWPFWRKRRIGYSTWDYEITYNVFVD